MRVLMVSSLWPPAAVGGAELYAATLTNALRADGHDVAAVTLGVEGADVIATVRPRPVRVDELRTGPAWRRPLFHAADVWRPGTKTTLKRAISKFRPDVVHTHVTQGMSVTALTTPSRLGVPHVHTLHDYWLRCWRSTLTTRTGRPCDGACRAIGAWRQSALRMHRPDVVVAISTSMLDEHPGVRGTKATTVLHHPVEAARSRPRHAEGRRGVVLGYIGQLTPNKGLPVLLDAIRQSRATLIVAGRGRLEPAVRAAAGDGVRYLGWVSGAAREAFFDEIDCLVVPSVWKEPAGLAVNEAVARGIPVIATATGGLPEYVPAECAPLLAAPGDARSLVQSIARFSADPLRYRPAPVAAERRWPAHLRRVLDCYEAAARAA